MSLKLFIFIGCAAFAYGFTLPMAEVQLDGEIPFGTTLYVIPYEAELIYIPDEELAELEQLVEVEPVEEKAERIKRQVNLDLGVGQGPFGGADVSANLGGNIWKSPDGRSTLNGNAFYERHFRGQFGTQRPNYGGGLTFTHRF